MMSHKFMQSPNHFHYDNSFYHAKTSSQQVLSLCLQSSVISRLRFVQTKVVLFTIADNELFHNFLVFFCFFPDL